MRYRSWLLGLPLALLCVAGCSGCAKGTRLTGGGSSFVNPIMVKWTTEYKDKKGVTVDYTSSGSGDGISKMIGGQNLFGCTDAPMTEEQLQEAGGPGAVIHVPLVMGAVVVIYNLEGVQDLKFTGKVLADIYLGNIRKWNDGAIAKLNPGAKLPDQEIAVVHRADGSGTSYIFTDYLSSVSPDWKDKVGKGTNPKWPLGQGEVKNPAVAKAVATTPGAIGYVELIYALQNPADLHIGLVENSEKRYVTPSLESVTAAADGALKTVPDDLRFSIVNAPGKDAYPISGTTWAVCKVKQPDGTGKALADFLRWCIHDGQNDTKDLRYARLPSGLVERAEKKIDLIQ